MTDIATIDTSQRAILLFLERNVETRAAIADQIASSRSVSSFADDPSDFALASSLSNQAAALGERASRLELQLNAVESDLITLDAARELAGQLQGIVNLARASDDPARISTLARQFDIISTQLRDLAGTDAGLSAGFDGFVTDTGLESAGSAVGAAIEQLRVAEFNAALDIGGLDVQFDFANNLGDTLTTASGLLVNSNLTELAAQSVAVQLRDQLALSGFSLAAGAQFSLSNLFLGEN